MINQTLLPQLNINDIHLLCQHYLNIVYRDIQQHSKQNFDKKNVVAETQGEILYESIDKILSHISLTEQDIFVDLGSATGKIVTQVFLKSRVKEALGIEIVPELHHKASLAAARIQQDLPDFFAGERKLTFSHGSFLSIPFTTATVALINATCFSQQLLHDLGEIINTIPSIHTVLTSRPIAALSRLAFKKTIRIECSWDTALCYVYEKR